MRGNEGQNRLSATLATPGPLGKQCLKVLEASRLSALNLRDRAMFVFPWESQKNSKRLWRSRRRKSSSVPSGAANFPAAVFLAGKCPNLGRDSILRCRKIAESFSNSVEMCRKAFPAGNFGQPQPSRVF